MGTYYRIVCDEAQEFIDPNDFCGAGRKLDALRASMVGAMALSVFGGRAPDKSTEARGEWTGRRGWSKSFRIVSDATDDFHCLGDPAYQKDFGGSGNGNDYGSYKNASEVAYERAVHLDLLPVEWRRSDDEELDAETEADVAARLAAQADDDEDDEDDGDEGGVDLSAGVDLSDLLDPGRGEKRALALGFTAEVEPRRSVEIKAKTPHALQANLFSVARESKDFGIASITIGGQEQLAGTPVPAALFCRLGEVEEANDSDDGEGLSLWFARCSAGTEICVTVQNYSEERATFRGAISGMAIVGPPFLLVFVDTSGGEGAFMRTIGGCVVRASDVDEAVAVADMLGCRPKEGTGIGKRIEPKIAAKLDEALFGRFFKPGELEAFFEGKRR